MGYTKDGQLRQFGVFDFVDALIAAASAEGAMPADVIVNDGFGVNGDGDSFVFLMIGVEDLLDDGATTAASADQEWAHVNTTTRDETGSVMCAAWASNGDGDQRAARHAVRDVCDALAGLLRENVSLDVGQLLWSGIENVVLVQDQDRQGASALATIRVGYRARV